MSSNAPPNLNNKISAPAKICNPPSQQSSTHSATNAYFATEGLGQRRSGGSGSFGSGASSKASGTPRNNQTAKSKHKQGRRFRLADEDAFAESAAMHNANSRKGQTSITHLMNFALPPRPAQQHQHRFNNQRGQRRNPTWGLGSGYHAVDKARYVHANYRFIVDPRGDYKVQAVDADVHLDWNNILQVIVSPESQQASCPICLGTPTAPRMAKCGHVFCLPCLIRYMHSDDGSNQTVHHERRPRWKKCPICYDAIYTTETRPVRMYQGQEGETPRDGMDVVLRLVQRPASSTLAMPRESPDAIVKGDDIPWYFAAEVMDYARVMKGGEEYIRHQLDIDISAIRSLEQEDELMFGEDSEWTGRAVRLLTEAKEKFNGMGDPPASMTKPEESKPKKPAIQFNSDISDVPEMYNIQQASRSGQSIPVTGLGAAGDTAQAQQGDKSAAPESTTPARESLLSTRLADFKAQRNVERQPDQYFFYQALLHYYLSPLDIRVLKDAFGSYESFPSSILPRVERVSHGHIVDDELRRKVKYLAHLPYGCEVGFLECDWTDTVPPAVLERYQADLDRRRKRNSDKEAREEKERQRVERIEEKEFASARRRRANLSMEKFNENDFQPLVASDAPSELSASVEPDISGSASSPPWIGQSHRTHSSGYATLASPGTSPSATRTVWGTAAVPMTSPELRALPKEEPVDDGWLQDWEKDLMRDEDEAVARIAAASLQEDIAAEAPPTPQASGGKGKKKNKKITLMSTTARRGA